jgi:hypothetical protein
MRSNRNDSKCGGGDCARSTTTTTSVSSGHGPTVSGGDGTGEGKSTKDGEWFQPVVSEEEVSDCPGGICPVPWATNPSFNSDEKLKERPVLTDNVNHPSHYTDGGIECIEAIESQLTLEEYRGYLKGNVAKYVWRERHKGGIESLQKAQWYLDKLIQLE